MRLASFLLLTMVSAPGAFAGLLYDNTAIPTPDTLVFSVGPFDAIGDQIHLVSAGIGQTAQVEFYNAGGLGTFDAILRLYALGAPVGAPFGGDFTQTGIVSLGNDVIGVAFNLGGLALPADLIFLVSLARVDAGMDLGLDFYEPPGTGSSDNSFLIAHSGGFAQFATTDENLYFQITGEITGAETPEPATWLMWSGALSAMVLLRRSPRFLPAVISSRPRPTRV
ncbi:MAG: hypothetical protein ABI759_10740 [Candidatus Solibacter sp.]